MAVIGNFTLNGIPFDTVREVKNWTINAQFGLNSQPSINLADMSFTNTNKSLTSDMVRQAHNIFPTEGANLGFEVSDGTSTFPFSFILDYNTYREVAPNETYCSVKLDKSIDSLLDLQGEDITMRLLQFKGLIGSSQYVAHPYVIENRKTLLEKLAIAAQTAFVFKTLADEVFKIINIAADLTSLGAIQAAINLAQTIAALVIQTNRLINLIEQLRESFFPPMRYHSAIELKTFLNVAAAYLGYSIEYGTWSENVVLIPSKNDEEGSVTPAVVFFEDGILKPSDFGYNLKDAFQLTKLLANTRLAIIGDVIHCRPVGDPFWNTSSAFVMPSTLIESSVFVDNGGKRYNREDLKAGVIKEYLTDDSDYWTIQQAANDSNGDRMVTDITTPITVVNERNVNINGIDIIPTPYALVVRKSSISDLVDSLSELSEGVAIFIEAIENAFGSVEDVVDSIPELSSLSAYLLTRDGALKCENSFFSTPKLSILETNTQGQSRIPENFNELIGMKALYRKYFNYDSLVPFVRNPLDGEDTGGKEVFENVKIKFNISQLILLLNNSYFSTQDGKKGQFTRIDWNVDGDYCICDYWTQNNWIKNIQQTIS